MTIQERRNPALLNGSRRRRIAEGSGTSVTEINRLMKQFLEMKKMMQRVSKLGVRSLMNQMPNPFH
jgi:signal recognition particle subunit SRP54